MVKNTENPLLAENALEANFSSLLYLLAEQQALLGRMLQVMLDNGLMTSHQLDKATDIHGEDGGLVTAYNDLYQKFAQYYLRTKTVLDENSALARELLKQDGLRKDLDDE